MDVKNIIVLCFLVSLTIVVKVNCFKDSHHYPCSWVGKTFKVSEGNVSIGVWDFDFTGKGSMLDMLGEVLQLECVKIEGQFIILRKIGTDMTSCMSIYNVTGDAFKFYYSKKYMNKPLDTLSQPNSLCDICRDFVPYIARVNGKADGLVKISPPCLYPKGCNVKDKKAVCYGNREQKIDEGVCDRTPPKMPMMNMMMNTKMPMDKSMMPMDKSMLRRMKSMMPMDKSMLRRMKSMMPMDKSKMPMDESMMPMDNSMLQRMKSMMPMDKSMLRRMKSMMPMDKSKMPMDKSKMPMDKSMMPMDKSMLQRMNSMMPMDKSKMPMDKSKMPMDESMMPMDNSMMQRMKSMRKIW